MSPQIQTLVITFGAVVALMMAVWVLATFKRDASLIDPVWGSGFVLVAWIVFLRHSLFAHRDWLLVLATTVWGLRLSLYLAWRNWGHGEDRRYTAMRAHHGARFWWVSLFTVFLLQAVILWFVSLPVQGGLLSSSRQPLGTLDFAGLFLWGIGFFFECVGDWQLARFRRDPASAGRVLDRGLWKYTRHPNYFGDFCVWWGLYLIAVAGGAWWTIASPLVMSILLLAVSGVRLLETDIGERRSEYASYKSRTSPFFPWFPRQAQNGTDQKNSG